MVKINVSLLLSPWVCVCVACSLAMSQTRAKAHAAPVAEAEAPAAAKQTLASRAGLHIPPVRVGQALEAMHVRRPISKEAKTFLAGVVEYILGEVIEAAAEHAHDTKHQRVGKGDILAAIRGDAEMEKLLQPLVMSASDGAVISEPFPDGPGPLDLEQLGVSTRSKQVVEQPTASADV